MPWGTVREDYSKAGAAWEYFPHDHAHSWMRWRCRYPQASFPYEQLVAGNARRCRADPEFGLLDRVPAR